HQSLLLWMTPRPVATLGGNCVGCETSGHKLDGHRSGVNHIGTIQDQFGTTASAMQGEWADDNLCTAAVVGQRRNRRGNRHHSALLSGSVTTDLIVNFRSTCGRDIAPV